MMKKRRRVAQHRHSMEGNRLPQTGRAGNQKFGVRVFPGRIWFVRLAVMACVFCLAGPTVAQDQKIILVVGAAGLDEYGARFEQWANNWQNAIETPSRPASAESKDSIEVSLIGMDEPSEQSDRQRLQAEIESCDQTSDELWIVLMGHGTDDRKTSKFNLRGPDLAAAELNQWLEPLSCRLVVINCASASGAFISKLKGENRIIVTATKSGAQLNFARFGEYLSKAIADPAMDLDKDQQTSLLEAFIGASAQTQEFYLSDKRLATELALIDDNGDGLGTPADWFEGIRTVRKSKTGEPDGLASNQVFLVRRGAEAQLSQTQREMRDNLEAKLENIRLKKQAMTEDAYLRAIEPILLDLARIYAAVGNEN